ncbi:MAG: hypothetical protein ACFCBV_05270 [Phycisphaerales bacterium]
MHGQEVVLSVLHPGGTHSSSKSLLLDIGAGGAAILYPGFLYNDAECVLHIETTSGEPEMLQATLAWCRVLNKGVHMVGIRWTELFDIRQFVPSSRWGELGTSGDNVASPDVSGKVLAIGMDELEIELLKMLLKDLPIQVESAGFAGAAIDSLHDQAFDLLFVNGDCPELDHASFTAKLRHEGFDEPVFVLIDRKHLPDSSGGLEGVQYLARPLGEEGLLGSIRDAMLKAAEGTGGSKPIVSDRANDPDLHGPIGKFVRHARELRQTLRGTINTDNTEEARRCLVLLSNTSSGFGFLSLSDAAAGTLKALDASGSAQEAGPAIKQFIRVLDRLADPSQPAQAA